MLNMVLNIRTQVKLLFKTVMDFLLTQENPNETEDNQFFLRIRILGFQMKG